MGSDGAGFLEDDFAGIAAFVDVVDGHAGFSFVGGEDGFMDGCAEEVFTGEFGDEGGMNVDYFAWEFLDELRRENAHVAHKNYEIDLGFFEGLGHFVVKLFAGEICGVDEEGAITLFLGALKGVAVRFITDYYAELNAGHEASFHLIDDCLEVGAVGGGEDADAEHRFNCEEIG